MRDGAVVPPTIECTIGCLLAGVKWSIPVSQEAAPLFVCLLTTVRVAIPIMMTSYRPRPL